MKLWSATSVFHVQYEIPDMLEKVPSYKYLHNTTVQKACINCKNIYIFYLNGKTNYWHQVTGQMWEICGPVPGSQTRGLG